MKKRIAMSFVACLFAAAAVAAEMPANYRLLYEQPCQKAEALGDFVFADPAGWRLGKDADGRPALELFAVGRYKPKYRSPLGIALVRDKRFGDFILDAEIMSTKKPYGHQDMCLFFSFQDPERFNYAHVALRQDAVAHRVMVVNKAPRAVLPTEGTTGVAWGVNVWHKVRLERKASDGTIKVYFDDMTRPVETANDKTFGAGYVGFGSFDDTGMVRNIKIYGETFEEGKADFFKTATP